MYSHIQITKKYLSYILTASNGKGHGIHSPFVFDFVTKVLNDKTNYDDYRQVELLRKRLKQDPRSVTIQDMGAGSRITKEIKRNVKDIAKTALKPPKYAQLLYRIARHYDCNNIVELGTSLGTTTTYFSLSSPTTLVNTFEGSTEIATIAKENFNKENRNNINVIVGNFDDTLRPFLQSRNSEKIDLAFIDGNHREEPTLQYFHDILPHVHADSILIFDDIHWSEGMESAWSHIQEHKNVTLTIDLFFIGLVFFRKENKEKEHFSIRF